MASKSRKITLFQRKPWQGRTFSLEAYFSAVVNGLASHGIGFVVTRWHSKGLWRRLRIMGELRGVAARHDLVHITGDIHFAAIAPACRARLVLSVMDLGFLEGRGWLARWVLKTFWLTLPLKFVAHVTVISEATKARLMEECGTPSAKITVVPVFVSPQFLPLPGSRGFNADNPVILQVGTKPNKNLERLVRALVGFRCQLVIVGILSDLQRAVLAETGTCFSNHVNIEDAELVALYQQCDLLAFVSTYEGFGMPIVEAQCVDRVVVTSNLLSMPEVGGDGAHYVDPFSEKSIREGIEKVVTDAPYRERLIANGRVNRLRFDQGRICQQYLDVYEKALGAATGSQPGNP